MFKLEVLNYLFLDFVYFVYEKEKIIVRKKIRLVDYNSLLCKFCRLVCNC